MSDRTSDRLLLLLKTRGPATAAVLARSLKLTPMGVRQHLSRLAADGLVAHFDERRTVGRPKRHWQLAPAAEARFPDSHAQMTVEILGAVRTTFGEAGLDRLIAQREQDMLIKYKEALAGAGSLGQRLRRLAKLRSEEGYMAESVAEGDGTYILIENHCPVCAAARACQNLCRSELAIFSTVLADCRVERIDHILAGARRCAYRVTPTAGRERRRGVRQDRGWTRSAPQT
ncbi:MAG TPA: metalloregulator ArsR/SmtB family transcription factor [Dongiaceae bacterium]|jgi:predicted ArsR family transcriptional regulator|nr:metalloregulator ArsR/SmtB family transcription factor [Dongiaceae bacterium]